MKPLLFIFALLSLSFSAKIPNGSEGNLSSPYPRRLQSCQPGCLTCSSPEVCLGCDSHRVLKDGKCKCESPRILIETTCECPWYMIENPVTQNCEYIDLLDVAYHAEISPLFDAILQAKMNSKLRWAAPPAFTWTVACNYQSAATQTQLNTYLSTRKSDVLRIPSSLLEYNLECDVKVSYNNQNSVEISKEFSFTTLSYFQPQIQIVGGPFQIFTHTNVNQIIAEVLSLTGSSVSPSDLKVTWTQVSENNRLDVTGLSVASNPLRLRIPKCALSQGKLYTFRIDVKIGSNPLITSQEVTIGVYAPKAALTPLQTASYHIYTKDLKLMASQFSIQDECKHEGMSPSDLLDLSTAKYIWECVIVDLDYSNRRVLPTESADITADLNVVTHPDPQHLFYRSTPSKTLTIPSSYFANYQGYQFIFYLTVTVKSKISATSLSSFSILQPTLNIMETKAYVQVLNAKPFTDVTFTCMNGNNCQTFTSDQTQFVAPSFNPKLTYTWIFNTFSAFENHEIYQNWLTVYTVGRSPRFVPQIILQATDGINKASAFFTLPLQTAMVAGSVYIYPSSGEAYNTNFFVSTYLSKDDDLPLTFQFFTTCATGNNYMLQKSEPYDYTLLLLPPSYGGCRIGVRTTESSGYFTLIDENVPLTGRSMSLKETLERGYLAMDSSRSSSNLYQRLNLISVILQNLQAWEGVYPPDETMYETSSQFKFSAISELQDIALAVGSSRADMKEIMLKNIMWASEQLFNEDRNWKLYMSIIDGMKPVLTSTEYRTFGAILDNLIYYMKKPENGIVDPEKVFSYANIFIKNTLSSLFPSDINGFNYDGLFYAMFTMKTTYCKLLEELTQVPSYYNLRANFTVKPGKIISPEKCNQPIDFVYLSFRPNYIVAGWGEFRTVVALDLRDSKTGKSVLHLFDYFLFSPFDFCPDESSFCQTDPNGGGTTIYGAFEIKNQIYKIFGKSKIDQIVNISALSDFKFWQSVAFWTVIGFSIWFLISFYWLYIKHPTYCALAGNTAIPQRPLYKKSNFFFWLVHPLMGIYLYNDKKSTKATRIALYYQRLVVVMVFSTIFSSISKGEGAIFRAYIILFNLCTVIPINSLLTRIFGWIFKLKISPKKKFIAYLKKSIAILLYLLFLVACFIVIFIIEAQQDQSQNQTWAINFAISFLQDFTLSPLINIILKVFFIKFSLSKKTAKLKRTRMCITFLLENFKSIYISIFESPLTPQETQPPTPTEIASPLSTSRKLLKLSTLDIVSPTLSPAKRVFRTRRVSDTEMGNVDSVAAETLVTDRFQTIFAEGKTEQMKPLSLVKQNYERMQSANIANSKDFNTNRERKFVNRTSIILSPSDPLPEQVEIELEDDLFSPDESPRGTQDSIPKARKDKRSFGTSLFSTQEGMEKMKNDRALGSSAFSTREKIKKPPPERCQTVI